MKKIKEVLLFIIVLLLLVGVASAAENVQEDNTVTSVNELSSDDVGTDTIENLNTGIDDAKEVIQDSNILKGDIPEKVMDNKQEKKLIKQEKKDVKTESYTYNDVNSYDKLISAGSDYYHDTIIVNITSDMSVGYLYFSYNIKNITIDGNNHTMDMNEIYLLDIRNYQVCTIKNLIINCNGCAVYNYGNLTIINTTVQNNTQQTDVPIKNEGNLTIIDSVIQNNKGRESISNLYGKLTIIGSVIQNNWADYGNGAISNSFSNFTITDSLIQNNWAEYGGGAIANSHGNGTIVNSFFLNNRAGREFGGAIQSAYGKIDIYNSTLNNNTAYQGGAIDDAHGRIRIVNSTLNGNNATTFGGVIFHQELAGYTINVENEEGIWETREVPSYIILVNSTFTDNKASNGSVLYDVGYNSAKVGNNTITGNIFQRNFAINKETLNTGSLLKQRIIKDNTYESTDISLNTLNLTLNDDKTIYRQDEDITLNFRIELERPLSYDDDIVDKLSKEIYINDELYNTTKNNNYALSNLAAGEYSVYIKTCNYTSDPITFKILEKLYINITELQTVQKGEILTIKGTLTDENNNALKNRIIKILINNGRKTLKTDEMGVFTFDYTTTRVGENTLKVTCDDSEIYQGTTTETTFMVSAIPTVININPINPVIKGSQVTITGTLTDENDNPISNTQVRIRVNDSPKTLKTDENGIFTHNYVMGKLGENNISAEFTGSTSYKATETTIKVEVLKSQTVITINPISPVTMGENINVTGKINDENDNVLSNAQVKILINNSPKTLKTDDNGVFTHTFKMIQTGKNNISVEYAGSNMYEASKTLIVVNVEKYVSLITIDPIGPVTMGENINVTGKISDENDNVLSNAQVKILINNSPKTLKTDDNGVFTHTFKMTKEGTNNITVVFKGNNNYKSTETNTTIEVIKAE